MPLYHLRATARRRAPAKMSELDFFVTAASHVEAGARAHDAFRENGWEFAEYLVLPHETLMETLQGPLKQAAMLALKNGECLHVFEAA